MTWVVKVEDSMRFKFVVLREIHNALHVQEMQARECGGTRKEAVFQCDCPHE